MPHDRTQGVLTPHQVVERARSAIGRGTHYELGRGGRDPFASLPSGAGKTCDCSGFAAWAAGVDRYISNTGLPHLEGLDWFETSALVRDALTLGVGYCDAVNWLDARPGDLVVYGDHRDEHGVKHQGHVGVVALAHEGPVSVVHCSKGNDLHTGDAIRETGPGLFVAGHAIVVRLAWVREAVV